MARSLVAVLVVGAFVTACSHPWPRPVATVDARLAGHALPLSRVDVLPIDLALWTDGRRGDPDQLRGAAEATLAAVATDALFQRGWLPAARIQWDGGFVDDTGATRTALAPADVLATIEVLAGYGGAATKLGGLPQPPLPARLGASGAEATLYVGGWSFVGDDRGSGHQVVKVLAIAAVVVIAVVVAVALAKSKGGNSSLGRAADGLSSAAVATGRVAVHGLARAGTALVHVGRAGARMTDRVLRGLPGSNVYIHLGPDPYPYGPGGWEPAPYSWQPAPSTGTPAAATPTATAPALPRTGHSQLYLEMTLVDNRDGHVLWHVHQQFPASGGSPDQVRRAAAAMLATMPAAR
ncbi:MAG: hypothetical protein R3B06_02410 [Kofleriaceae bacterium]